MKRTVPICALLAIAFFAPAGMLLAQTSEVFFEETFDTITPPELPNGWSDSDSLWETSSSVASTGSGLNNLTIAGSQSASIETPVIDLSGLTAGTLSYLARRTSTYVQDSLRVLASVDGGGSFPIVLLTAGTALPGSDGSYASISVDIPPELLGQANVVLAFNALGGSTSGSNIRIDDVLISGEGDPGMATSTLGFSTDSSVVALTSSSFDIDVALDFTNLDNLQGLQFSIAWDNPAIFLQDVIRGSAISNEAAWRVSFDARTGEMRGVVLGDQLNNLPSGLYDPLLTLQFGIDPTISAGDIVFTAESVLGALAVRTGDDAALDIGRSTHTVSLISAGEPAFDSDLSQWDFGDVAFDSVSTTQVSVTNNGNSDLLIASISSTNTLFFASPETSTIGPGTTEVFEISFSPTFTAFGYQAANLIFAHNASGGSDSLQVVAVGTGGQGDVSGDGLVDALDLVSQIDFILETTLPTERQQASGDVYPYAAVDNAIDIRDLTVMAQAIVFDAWPDDVQLPVPSPGATAGKTEDSPVSIQLLEEDRETTVLLKQDIPLRAIQFTLKSAGLRDVSVVDGIKLMDGIHVMHHYDRLQDALRVVLYRSDGELLEAGTYPVLTALPGRGHFEQGYSVAVDHALNRYPIRLENGSSTQQESLLEEEIRFILKPPFPNPFSIELENTLTLPIRVERPGEGIVEIFDILGRTVGTVYRGLLSRGEHALEWTGRDVNGLEVAPGLYLVRVVVEGQHKTRKIVVH